MKKLSQVFKDPLYLRFCSFFSGALIFALGGALAYISYIALNQYIWVIPCVLISLLIMIVGFITFLFTFVDDKDLVDGSFVFFGPGLAPDLILLPIQIGLFISVGFISIILTLFIRLFIPLDVKN
ncbi:MAG: hypothetical protein RR569_03235 [Acinetobacter sp.]